MKCVCMSLVVPPPLVDNASDFNVVVAETLIKYFYVDDLLKSVKSKDSATHTRC